MPIIDLLALDGTDGFRLNGRAANDIAGTSIDIVGDFNGDGFDDVLIGAGGGDEAFLVFGAAGGFAATIDLDDLDGSDGFRMDGGVDTGYAVAAAGDVDGDGFDDLILGDRRDQFANVVFGDDGAFAAALDLSTLDGADGYRIDVSAFGNLAAYSVGAAGDINGDGVADVVVGSPEADPSDSGSAAIVFGDLGASVPVVDAGALAGADGVVLDPNALFGELGFAASGVGDVNGDGLDDLIVSAPDAAGSAGRVFVLFGRTGGFDAPTVLNAAALDGSNGFVIEGRAGGDLAGRDAAAAGDVNGDGLMDIAIGSRFAGDAGEAYVVFGRSDGAASVDLDTLDGANGFRVDGDSAVGVGDGAGTRVRGVGDFNGDGFDDVAVTAPFVSIGQLSFAGQTFIFFGKESGFAPITDLSAFDDDDGVRIDGVESGAQLGTGLSGGGDINGDGFDDLIAGARLADANGGDSGQSFVIFGRDFAGAAQVGTAAGETITGNGQANALILGQGDDIFNAGGGADVVRGGEGRDQGSAGGGNDRVSGGAGDDVLNGSLGDDMLFGDAGADRLVLGLGNDAAYGGAGDDLIFERANHLRAGDVIVGGEGLRDTLVVQSTGVLDLTLLDTFAGMEQVRVAANQQITSVDADLRWIGRSGAETYGLGDGRDTVKAGGGDDTVSGGGGNDVLLGQGGDDRLIAGAGVDRLRGDSGADDFVFAPGDDVNVVFDFTIGQDQIDLSAFGFTDFDTQVDPLLDDSLGRALIGLGNEDVVLLNGVASSTLTAGDFILA